MVQEVEGYLVVHVEDPSLVAMGTKKEWANLKPPPRIPVPRCTPPAAHTLPHLLLYGGRDIAVLPHEVGYYLETHLEGLYAKRGPEQCMAFNWPLCTRC